MPYNKGIAPLLKWVGGKRQLMPILLPRVPAEFTTYYEPFVGGGAVLFSLLPDRAVINDVNEELINVYRIVKDKVEDLIVDLKSHENTKEYYHFLRSLDRDPKLFATLDPLQRASRTIFLNKTCYNGLFRVNSHGQFNSPYGRYEKTNIVNEGVLRGVSAYFRRAQVELQNKDFEESLLHADTGSFVYLDPPYDPLSSSSSFTNYNKGGFTKQEQLRLKSVCDSLHNRGARFLLSNSHTSFVAELYREYTTEIVRARRAINSKGDKRGEVEELLIRNYD